jgi:hypothetical protein
MTERLTVRVYRRDDDLEQPGRWQRGDAPVDWVRHWQRAVALYEVLDDDAVNWRVVDWGNTEDHTRTHEVVRLTLEALDTVTSGQNLTPMLTWMGGVLTGVLTNAAWDGIKALVPRLRRKQEERSIDHVIIEVQGGPQVTLGVPSAEGPGQVIISIGNQNHSRSW